MRVVVTDTVVDQVRTWCPRQSGELFCHRRRRWTDSGLERRDGEQHAVTVYHTQFLSSYSRPGDFAVVANDLSVVADAVVAAEKFTIPIVARDLALAVLFAPAELE